MDLSNLEYVERDGVKYEVVEVYFGGCSWLKRVCLWHDSNICITIDNSKLDDFLNGRIFSVLHWGKEYWRPLQKKHYVPFTMEDAHLFRDRWLCHKNLREVYRISLYDAYSINICGDNYDYKQALELLTFDDGTPFGKEVNHE